MIRFLVPVFLFGLGPGLAAQESGAPEERAAELRRDVAGVVRGVPKGATVRVTLWRCDFQRYRSTAIGETLAGADGSFAMPGVPWFTYYRWLNTGVLVVARCKGKAGLVRLPPGSDLTKVGVDLTGDVDLRGRVTDRDTGLPIENVTVWPANFGDSDRLWTTAPVLPWLAQTDAEGRFVVRGLPRTDTLEFFASGPKHAQARVFVQDAEESADFTLEQGGRIRGVVRMPNGSPAVRVQVVAAGRRQFATAMTDERGRFCVNGLAADSYLLFSDIDGRAVIAVNGVHVEAGKDTVGQIVQVVRGGWVRGRLVDPDTGRTVCPKRHCDVAANGPARPTARWCQGFEVALDGTFRCLLPPGENRLRLRGGDLVGVKQATVDVVDGEATAVTFEVRPRKQ